jgi:hypothetical protein
MNALTQTRFTGNGSSSISLPTYEDPTDADEVTDRVVLATSRGLTRLALIAAEAGARFEREGSGQDPMTWMLSPRRLFGGRRALDAVLDRENFMRALLLHGLALGLDADASMIDALAAEEDDFEGCGEEPQAEARAYQSDALRFSLPGQADLRLFTATVVANDGFETVQAFHASLATEEAEVAGRLYCRIGAASAGARIIAGFDPSDPLVAALVSEAMGDTLTLIEAQPGSPIAAGLDVNIEQRFYG